ncbi:MAG: NAD(P)/FAD-dependent oxidoreductase [Pyrinomonadaceae bacterium]
MSEKSAIRNPQSAIAVVGAGPAGASLAIRLAKENFKITLIEREKFPRSKLCGEFISPECFRHFRELGVLDEMFSAGGDRIAETVFYAPNGKNVSVPSEWFNAAETRGALSLSRAEMDFRLLKKAKEIGVEVLEEHQVVSLSTDKDKIRAVKLRAKNGETKEISADLYIDATGRAAVLGKLAGKCGMRNAECGINNRKIFRISHSAFRTCLVGFKAHLKNVNLEKGACEIYFFQDGYGGLSRVENNLANFCFLIKADAVKKFSGDAVKIISEIIFQNERARATLRDAEPVHEWLAVSVDNFGEKDLNPAQNLLAVGDAGAFIDPFTGSGMLMAFESAEILARTLTKNSAIEKIAETYKIEHARKFQRRLFVCSLMRRAAFAPTLSKFLIAALSLSDLPRKILARLTRQTV